MALWGAAAVLVYLLLDRLSGGGLVSVDEPAPALRGELYGGGEFDLEDRRGSITVVNFWATWCPPCRAEAPALARAHRRLEAGGGTVVGVALEGPLATVGAAGRSLGMGYPILQATAKIQNDFRVHQLPTTYVIGPRGRVARTAVGEVTDAWLEEAIERAAGH